MYVPVDAAVVAVKVSNPDGFVSDAAYVTFTPTGSPTKLTRAVSLEDRIAIWTWVAMPPRATVTEEELSETEMGTMDGIPLPPHPVIVKAVTKRRMPQPGRSNSHILISRERRKNESRGKGAPI